MDTVFLEEEKSKEEIKKSLDDVELQLFRMKESIKEIAKRNEVISIDQTRKDSWVVVYADRDETVCQLMLHDCQHPFRGNWDSAIQAEFQDAHTIHIADIKGKQNRGYGSVLIKHLKEIAREENVQYITGDIAERDADHFDRLTYFYRKHAFQVDIDYEEQCGEILWNDS
ncbi:MULTISPECIES: GNAT family N-acetyltransferase [unclassified Virgibacillus]|uniref:GNAT family N-acetyltransferase n=1 Tax=unclassified Virgibacillus TaxID=2620237 RepID=UPI0024DE31D4|nr:GNAT family N-acetyltransferase [Virgibacillus sp. LDC-1]